MTIRLERKKFKGIFIIRLERKLHTLDSWLGQAARYLLKPKLEKFLSAIRRSLSTNRVTYCRQGLCGFIISCRFLNSCAKKTGIKFSLLWGSKNRQVSISRSFQFYFVLCYNFYDHYYFFFFLMKHIIGVIP